MRSVNLHVTSRAVSVLSVQIVLRACRLNCSDVMRHAVASQTKLVTALNRNSLGLDEPCGV